jgi:manganese oxidase
MGGMFTVLKVRRQQQPGDYSDPGWYAQPPGTQAYEHTGALTQAPRAPEAASPQGKQGDVEVTVRKPAGHAGH